MEASQPRSASEIAADDVKYHCLCGMIHVKTGSIVICVSEILILCHGLIFAVTNHFAGEHRYESGNPVFYEVVKYDYLLPFFIVLILWILSNVVLLIGTKLVFAPLVLPHLIIQIPAILSGVVLIVACIVNITNAPRVNWELLLSLSVFLLYTLAEIYFCFVIYSCYKFLKVTRVKVAVQKSVLKTAEYQSSDEETESQDKKKENKEECDNSSTCKCEKHGTRDVAEILG